MFTSENYAAILFHNTHLGNEPKTYHVAQLLDILGQENLNMKNLIGCKGIVEKTLNFPCSGCHCR